MANDDPPKTLVREKESDRNRAEVSLSSLILIFQLLMALAITNSAYAFFTNGSGSYALRPWSTYTPYQVIQLFAFATFIFPFVHADVLVMNDSYRLGFTGKRLQPILDFFILYLHAALFYMLSFALIDSNNYDFYFITAGILILNVAWAVISFAFDHSRRVVLIYAGQNTVAVAAGIWTYLSNFPMEKYILVAILLVRNLVDFVFTYDYLFPGAFWRHRIKFIAEREVPVLSTNAKDQVDF